MGVLVLRSDSPPTRRHVGRPQLVHLREHYLAEAARARSRVGELIGLLFANAFLTVRRVETALGITNQGARQPHP